MTKAALKDKPEDLVFINNLAIIFIINAYYKYLK